MGNQNNNVLNDFYLYLGNKLSPSSVIFKVQGLDMADAICVLFYKAYRAKSFNFSQLIGASVADEILLAEALNDVTRCANADEGVYDSPPPPELLERAHLARRAAGWYELLQRRRDRGRQAPVSQQQQDEPLGRIHLRQADRNEHTEKNASRSPDTPKPATFAAPKEATWSDVKLKFVDGETVAIKVASEPMRRFIYADLNMMDARSQKPNKQWELLRKFARNGGTVTWKSQGAASNVGWQQRELAKKLKAFVGIEGEPIVLNDDRKGWHTVFAIEPDT